MPKKDIFLLFDYFNKTSSLLNFSLSTTDSDKIVYSNFYNHELEHIEYSGHLKILSTSFQAETIYLFDNKGALKYILYKKDDYNIVTIEDSKFFVKSLITTKKYNL